jgi:hypothetical protein
MKGTVTISVEEYNEMRDFYNGMKANKTTISGGWHNLISVVSTEEAVKIIASHNDSLQKEIVEMKNSKLTLDKIKSMSLFEFIKWKSNYEKYN